MRKTVALAAGLALIVSAMTASAQNAERYRLEKTENGYVRMDTRTGEMSICRERSDQLVCTVAADERSAYHDDIGELRAMIEALETRMAALEKSGGVGVGSGLPSEEEFEQTMGLMERFFRRFMGIVKDLEKESGGSAKDEPVPERT